MRQPEPPAPVLSVSHGAWLHVRIDDPDQILPEPDDPDPRVRKLATQADPIIQPVVWADRGLPHFPEFLSHDNFGRNYVLAVPRDRAFKLMFDGKNAAIVNEKGTWLSPKRRP